jgi:hypothetical protein
VLALDPQAGGVAATYLRERGQRILDELAGVGGDGADGERTRLPGTGQTGWRKAAELLDGSAFAVGPAQQR